MRGDTPTPSRRLRDHRSRPHTLTRATTHRDSGLRVAGIRIGFAYHGRDRRVNHLPDWPTRTCCEARRGRGPAQSRPAEERAAMDRALRHWRPIRMNTRILGSACGPPITSSRQAPPVNIAACQAISRVTNGLPSIFARGKRLDTSAMLCSKSARGSSTRSPSSRPKRNQSSHVSSASRLSLVRISNRGSSSHPLEQTKHSRRVVRAGVKSANLNVRMNRCSTHTTNLASNFRIAPRRRRDACRVNSKRALSIDHIEIEGPLLKALQPHFRIIRPDPARANGPLSTCSNVRGPLIGSDPHPYQDPGIFAHWTHDQSLKVESIVLGRNQEAVGTKYPGAAQYRKANDSVRCPTTHDHPPQ